MTIFAVGQKGGRKRAIDADELNGCLQTWKTSAVSEGLPINERFAVAMIAQVNFMPTIDPERKKGEWTIIDLGAAGVFDCRRECKRVVKHKAPFYDFCPHCGADMR